jgi:hypothetical protein
VLGIPIKEERKTTMNKLMNWFKAIDWKAGGIAALKAFLKVALPSAAGAAAALGLAGCSTQMPQPKGAGIGVINIGLPVVMWFTADQDAPSENEESNAAVQANPVTPTVDFPVVK